MKDGSPKYVVNRARELRDGMTEAEERLWKRLRRRALDGLRFRRQHPIHRYIVDFFCPERMLIVELDGSVHESTREYDQDRMRFLAGGGYTVLRFRNSEVMDDIDGVLERIRNTPPFVTS